MYVCVKREKLGRLIPLPDKSCGRRNLKGLSEWWQAAPKNKGGRPASRPAVRGRKRTYSNGEKLH
jgi:hypothetical protein